MIRRTGLLVVSVIALSGCANLLSWNPPPRREAANQSVGLILPQRPLGPQEYLVRQGDTMVATISLADGTNPSSWTYRRLD